MTVEHYSSKFVELAMFATNLVPNEESRAERFENGLNPRIRERVSCHEIRDYAKLVDIVSLAERGIRESTITYELKKRSMPQASYPSKRLVVGDNSQPYEKWNFSLVVRNQKSPCGECAKLHNGDCRFENKSCYQCGQTGHFVRDYPKGGRFQQRQSALARVYTLTPVDNNVEEEEGTNVVRGTIP